MTRSVLFGVTSVCGLPAALPASLSHLMEMTVSEALIPICRHGLPLGECALSASRGCSEAFLGATAEGIEELLRDTFFEGMREGSGEKLSNVDLYEAWDASEALSSFQKQLKPAPSGHGEDL
jgi:hypothetical protein